MVTPPKNAKKKDIEEAQRRWLESEIQAIPDDLPEEDFDPFTPPEDAEEK